MKLWKNLTGLFPTVVVQNCIALLLSIGSNCMLWHRCMNACVFKYASSCSLSSNNWNREKIPRFVFSQSAVRQKLCYQEQCQHKGGEYFHQENGTVRRRGGGEENKLNSSLSLLKNKWCPQRQKVRITRRCCWSICHCSASSAWCQRNQEHFFSPGLCVQHNGCEHHALSCCIGEQQTCAFYMCVCAQMLWALILFWRHLKAYK